MQRSVYYRNDEIPSSTKSYVVYENIENALKRINLESNQEVDPELNLKESSFRKRGTIYKSRRKILSIGMAAHENLRNVARSSIIYLGSEGLDCQTRNNLVRLLTVAENERPCCELSLFGTQAYQVSAFLPSAQARTYELPPMELPKGNTKEPGTTPRVTIINHLSDQYISKTLVDEFAHNSSYFIECLGLHGEPHNRVRYLADNEISEIKSNIHVHIGTQSEGNERLRICDSWQSHTPVLYLRAKVSRCSTGEDKSVKEGHNVLAINSFKDAVHFIELLLETPNLYRQLVANGREAASIDRPTWDNILRDIVK